MAVFLLLAAEGNARNRFVYGASSSLSFWLVAASSGGDWIDGRG